MKSMDLYLLADLTQIMHLYGTKERHVENSTQN